MSKYSERLVEKIVRLIEEDTYTIGEICDALKISRNSFYEWKNTKPEFRKAVDEAEYRRDDALAALVRRSLREQLEGYVVTTEKVIYVDDGCGGQERKSRTVTRKKYPPKANVMKLALERLDRKQDKKEAAENKPEGNPIVIKFAKDVDQNLALQTMINFKNNARGDQSTLRLKEEDEDDNYITVKI